MGPAGGVAGHPDQRDLPGAPNGYLWLATQRGLARFDGEQFKVFDQQSAPEFGTNWISSVLADSRGVIWVGTPAGLWQCDGAATGLGQWTEVGSHLPVKALAAGAAEVVWALTTNETLVEIAAGKPRAVHKIPTDQPLHLLLSDRSGAVLVAGRERALYYAAGRWTPVAEQEIAGVRPDLACRSQQGGFWFAAGDQVVRLAESGGELHVNRSEPVGPIPLGPITALLEDQTGCLWAGTRGGDVNRLEPPLGTAPQAGPRAWRQVSPKRLGSLGYVACLHEDSEGLIWAGTTGGYLHQIKHPLVTAWSLPEMTQDNAPQTVCVTRDGSVWLGTDGSGAYRFRAGSVISFGAEHGLSDGTVIAILEDRRTNLWLGTFGGLFRLEGERFQPQLRASLQGKRVPVLFEDQAGDLWFGTQGAVLRKHGEEVTSYSLGSRFEEAEVRAMAQAPDGQLWFAARGGGLFRLQEDHLEHFQRFKRRGVQALHCDANGVLWVGTAARGLFRVADNRLSNWSRADGLPSSWIHSILEDASGTLWLGSNEGVFGVTKQALMERLRRKDAPLPAIQVASAELELWAAGSGQPSAARGPDGRLWFPAGHGVLSFAPEEVLRPRPELPVLIETALVDDVEKPLQNPGGLKLYSGLKRLEIRYTIADLDSPGRLKFRYRLQGLDERWVDAGSQRTATYGPLPPGEYRFRVISSGSGNVWTETANPLIIRVVPHFWQTAWFQSGSGVLLLTLVGAVALVIGRVKLRRKLERLEMQQVTEKERRRIAQDLHDDVGSAISEIVFLSELTRQEQNASPAGAQPHLEEIAQKTRQIANTMDEIVWTINPKNDSLPDLASYLCDYAREFLRAANMGCRIDLTEELPAVPLTAPQRHNLFLAVKEALNNAVKHSGAKEVWLRILWAGGAEVTVSIEDNGRGFDPAQARLNENGNGLANMQTRLEAVGGRTELVSQPGQGARVSFAMPLPAQTLSPARAFS